MERTPQWKAKIKTDAAGCKATVTGTADRQHVVKTGHGRTAEEAIGSAFHLSRARFASDADEIAGLRSLSRGQDIEFDLRDRDIRIAA